MKIYKLKLIYLMILLMIFSLQLVLGADCDYTPLNEKISALETENLILRQINESYYSLLPKYDALQISYNDLLINYNLVKSERDLFESKYLSTSLGNMTIGEFIFYMNKTENYYNSLNQTITNQVNQMITIRNWTIGINISVALFSISIIFFNRKIRKYILAKITNIKINNEK